MLKKIARQAELNAEDVTSNILRHTFGKNLVDAGVPLYRVATLLGHANLNTTRNYYCTSPDKNVLQQDVEKITICQS